jgi:hypothetical protein
LKKRTKKLLLCFGNAECDCLEQELEATSKSFLFLFFKKEILPCFAGVADARTNSRRIRGQSGRNG